jgi:hypothetical protein
MVGAAAVLLLSILFVRGSGTGASSARPVKAPARPTRAPETRMPPRLLDTKRLAYAQAVTHRTSDTPGHDAFRRMSDRFVRHNLDAAKAQAAKEGLTLEEVRELTYFGQVVQHTQRWGEVEAILGRPPTSEEMEQASTLMHELDAELEKRMRAAVASGDNEAQRKPLIAEMQSRYEREYLAITGMTAEQLDDLLVADVSRRRRN